MGLDDDKVRSITPSTDLKESETIPLSLADIDRVLSFMTKIQQRWKNSTSSVKIGEDLFGLPQSINAAREIIDDSGGPKLVSYVNVIVPMKFSAIADFLSGILKIRYSDEELLGNLLDIWASTSKSQDIPAEITLSSVSRAARGFLLSRVQLDGTIKDTPQSKLDNSKAYLTVAFKELHLQTILNSYAMALLRTRNKDGGWSDSAAKRRTSRPLETASVIIALYRSSLEKSDKLNEAISKGTQFLMKKMKITKGALKIASKKKGIELTLVYLSLFPQDPQGVAALKDKLVLWLKKNREANLDPILLHLLSDAGIDTTHVCKELLRNYSIEDSREKDPENVAAVLYCHKEMHGSKVLVKELVDHLVSSMKSNGSWSSKPNESGSFSTTLKVLYALDRIMKKKMFDQRIMSELVRNSVADIDKAGETG